jgi:serine/threonine-protein kinase
VTDLLARLTAALVDRYTVERELGHGENGVVFLARDRKHRRAVAIKVISSELAQAVHTERFLREIKFAARLIHPHIIPLYDSGMADDIPYYVMSYAAGESLRDRLQRGGSSRARRATDHT